VMEYVQQIADAENAAIYMGQTIDASLGDEVKVTLVAAGFDAAAERPRDTRVYAEAEPRREVAAQPKPEPVRQIAMPEVEVEPDIPDAIREIDLDIPSFLRRRTARLQ
jgi:cell division protein FtsZ